MISTITYPLAAASAGQLSGGAAIGFLNGAWAIGLVLAPILAGALEAVLGQGAGFLVVVIPGALGATWLLSRSSTQPRRLRLAALRS
jgi:MFS family permease